MMESQDKRMGDSCQSRDAPTRFYFEEPFMASTKGLVEANAPQQRVQHVVGSS